MLDLEESILADLDEAAKALGCDPAKVIGGALRSFLATAPSARRALLSIDEIADPAERSFAAKLIGRSALRAYEGVLESRHGGAIRLESNSSLDDDDSIEAEAVRICATP